MFGSSVEQERRTFKGEEMAYLHGKSSKLTVGSTPTTLSIKSFSATPTVAKEDVTSTTSGGYQQVQGGIQSMEIEFEGDWDATVYPFATPPSLIPGTEVAFSFYASGTGTATITGTLYLESVPVKHAVDKVVTYSVKGVTTGTYTMA